MPEQSHVISNNTDESHHLRDIVRDVLQDVGRIVQAEIRVAKLEFTGKAASAGKAGGVLGAAAVTALLAGACFVTTCIAALALVMPLWLAALLMGVLLTFAAAGAFAVGRTKLGEIDVTPERTVQTLRDNIEWAKQRTE